MINEELQEKLLSVFDKRFENYNTKVLIPRNKIAPYKRAV